MSERNKMLAESMVHEIMVSMIALRHAAEPLLYAFILTHQEKLLKGDLSVFTPAEMAALFFGIVFTAFKTRSQRAADPINPQARS